MTGRRYVHNKASAAISGPRKRRLCFPAFCRVQPESAAADTWPRRPDGLFCRLQNKLHVHSPACKSQTWAIVMKNGILLQMRTKLQKRGSSSANIRVAHGSVFIGQLTAASSCLVDPLCLGWRSTRTKWWNQAQQHGNRTNSSALMRKLRTMSSCGRPGGSSSLSNR